jgi:heme exporter protein D
MIDLGKHAFFIWSSYAVVGATILGLIAWLIWDGRRQEAARRQLEAEGIRRRSDVG